MIQIVASAIFLFVIGSLTRWNTRSLRLLILSYRDDTVDTCHEPLAIRPQLLPITDHRGLLRMLSLGRLLELLLIRERVLLLPSHLLLRYLSHI